MSKSPKLLSPNLFPSERTNRLHRRAQRAESEVFKLRRQHARVLDPHTYWEQRFRRESKFRGELQREYNQLWRIVHEAEGKFLSHEEALKVLKARLQPEKPGFIRKLLAKLG
jgi:hypothetical protein